MKKSDFEPLVRPELDILYRVAVTFVGQSDAEDRVQDAVLNAWEAWDALDDTSKTIRAWLLRIVINVCHDWQRKNHRRPTVSLEQLGLFSPKALENNGTDQHIDVLDLYQALKMLDEMHHTIILLRYFGGLNATEIGEYYNLPPATIRTRLRRGLQLLREEMIFSRTLLQQEQKEEKSDA